jgi:hypothetical protein
VRSWISLAIVNGEDLRYGDEVELVWGEPDGGSLEMTGQDVEKLHDARASIPAGTNAKRFGVAGPDRFLPELAAGYDPARHGEVKLPFYTFGGLRAAAEWVAAFRREA